MARENPMVVVDKSIAKARPQFEKIAQPMGNLVRFAEEVIGGRQHLVPARPRPLVLHH